ncbi:MAG TPA: hypothetical protein VKT75_04130 [Acidobacteriaceae bacterium]|nr:hypothetical protein [Acidobacteriaceae bacterium]
MPESNSSAFHLVVQHTQGERQSSFRIVAYHAHARLRPAEFATAEELVRALRSGLPGFDERWLVLREPEYRGTYIAYMGDYQLDESQLQQLGLLVP